MFCTYGNAFGLKNVGDYPPTAIPLQSVQVNTTIINATADVVCNFAFRNDSDKTLETEFSFPLDSDSAVYHFEAKIGEKRLIAKCRERLEAEETYTKAVEENHTAFMLSENEIMGDFFVMKVGNVPPKEDILLSLRYFTPLTVRDADPEEERFKKLQISSSLLVLTLPFVLNDRYGPTEESVQRQFNASSTVPTMSSISSNCKLKFIAEVFGSSPILAVTSPAPQQTFVMKYVTEDKLSASVRLESPFSFESDLEMELSFAEPHSMMISYEPAAEATDAGTGDFLTSLDCLTTTFLPNFSPSSEVQEEEEVASAGRREIVFLIDRSGSMEGASIEQAKKALLIFLKSLPSDCRFQIVGFGSIHAALFSEPVDYTEETLKRALAYQADLEADMGGTEVLPALEAVYGVPLTGVGWSRQIVFLTDGDVTNQTEVISLVQKHSTDSRLFAVGLGMGASTSLVRGVARAGNGKAVFVRNPESLTTAVMDILNCALQDPVTEVALSWQVQSTTGSLPLEVLTIPSQLPPLFCRTYLTVFGLVKNPAREKLTGSATLTFKLNGQMHRLTARLPQTSSAAASSASLLHRQAAKTQIVELVDQHSGLRRGPDNAEQASSIQRKVTALAVAANVSSPFTSFIGVDPDSLVAPKRPTPPKMYDCVDYCGCLPMAAVACCNLVVDGLEPKTEAQCFHSLPPEAVCDSVEMDGAELEEEAQEPAAAVTTKTEDVVAGIAALQQFPGCWPLSAELARLLGCSLDSLVATTPSNFSGEDGRTMWATALVLAFLKVQAARRSTEWLLFAKKGRSWLVKHLPATGGGDSSLDSLLSLAKTTLTSLLPQP